LSKMGLDIPSISNIILYNQYSITCGLVDQWTSQPPPALSFVM